MSEPPKSGVIVYSDRMKELSEFYMKMFGMVIQREVEEFISISNEDFDIVIHSPPIELPKQNFNTVKMFLTVESHEQAKAQAVTLGGQALEGVWSNPFFKVCNIVDPDGNHIQIREFLL